MEQRKSAAKFKYTQLQYMKSGPRECSEYSNPLLAGESGDWIPVEARFSAHIQTGPWAHTASNTIRITTFPEVKRLRCGLNHPPTSSAKVKVRVQLHLYSQSLLHGTLWDKLYLSIYLTIHEKLTPMLSSTTQIFFKEKYSEYGY